MADITGKNMYISWAGTGGTVTLSTEYRSFSANPSVDLVEATAGADNYKTYLSTVKDGTFDYSGLLQSKGTAVLNALREGCSGTLTIAPEGTASGYPKEEYPCIVLGPKVNYPYSDVVEVSCSFQQSGTPSFSTY